VQHDAFAIREPIAHVGNLREVSAAHASLHVRLPGAMRNDRKPRKLHENTKANALKPIW
jgi:hypothetical protein